MRVLIRHDCMPSHRNDWWSDLLRTVTKGSVILTILQSKKWRYSTDLSDFSKFDLTDNHWKSFYFHLFNSLCVGGSRRCLSITLILKLFKHIRILGFEMWRNKQEVYYTRIYIWIEIKHVFRIILLKIIIINRSFWS